MNRIVSTGQLKALCEAIWRIESDMDLLRRSIGGVYYWSFLRPFFADVLGARLGWYQPVTPMRENPLHKILRHLSPLVSDARELSHPVQGPFDTVLISVRRHIRRDGRDAYIHSDAVLRDGNFGRFLVLLPAGFTGTFENTPGLTLRSLGGLVALGEIRGYGMLAKYLRAATAEHADISAAFRREFGVGLPISALRFAGMVAGFQEKRRLARKLLHASGAKQLLSVDATSRPQFVAAAHDLGMHVGDLQHGLVTKYQLTYSYPNRPAVPYTANAFLTYGQFWNESLGLPGNTKARVIGSDNIARYRAANIAKISRLAVIVSQQFMGGALFHAALAAARAAPDWTFVFRPHPRESHEA